jgi:hypothetical protein
VPKYTPSAIPRDDFVSLGDTIMRRNEYVTSILGYRDILKYAALGFTSSDMH